MLRDKITEKISELQKNFSSNQLRSSSIFQTLQSLKLSANFAEFNHLKSQGYAFNVVLSLLIWMIIQSKKTVNSSLSELSDNGITLEKDVYYRLKNNEKICWRRILWYVAEKFLQQTQKNNENRAETSENKKPRCLIFDDTLLEKTGNKIEKIGKVWDHVTNRMVLGFRLLVGLYFDGTSAIPVDFSIVREKGQKADKPFGMLKKYLRRQFSKKRVKESEGIFRVKELDISKIELSIQLFLRTVLHGITVDYVLCDSWFTCSDLIAAVRQKGSHLIGMYKFVKTKFEYQGRRLSYKEILHLAGKEKRCKKMNLYYKKAHVLYDGMPVTLFFSRIGTNGDWKVILTTDTKLSFLQAIEIYQIRWSIEVFFKEAKQLLNLGGCQSSTFDAQIADTTITMIAYILLAFRFRYDNYESMGALFRAMNAENLQKTIDIRLWELFVTLVQTVCQMIEKDIEEVMDLIMRKPEFKLWVENIFLIHYQQAS
jgi:predicted nucleic acid-binding Zn finger protein